MTSDEATKTIDYLKEDYKQLLTEEDIEALDMAIEALEQVTGKLNNPEDSLLTADSEACKEQKSKLDLISRQAAIDALDKRFDDVPMELTTEILQLRRDLSKLPSAQSEPKTGKWIRHDEVRNVYGGTYVECSECGEKYVVQYIEDEKFCRNCGADMRGE